MESNALYMIETDPALPRGGVRLDRTKCIAYFDVACIEAFRLFEQDNIPRYVYGYTPANGRWLARRIERPRVEMGTVAQAWTSRIIAPRGKDKP